MFEVGQKVVCPRVGAVPEFSGEIVSIAENAYKEPFAVVADAKGRSWHRSFHEMHPVLDAPSTLPAHG